MLPASVGGNRVPVTAQLVQADEDTVRDVIHSFNEIGLASLDPRWAGGRPRRLSPDDKDFVVATATTRPAKVGQPFTRWSLLSEQWKQRGALRRYRAWLSRADGCGHWWHRLSSAGWRIFCCSSHLKTSVLLYKTLAFRPRPSLHPFRPNFVASAGPIRVPREGPPDPTAKCRRADNRNGPENHRIPQPVICCCVPAARDSCSPVPSRKRLVEQGGLERGCGLAPCSPAPPPSALRPRAGAGVRWGRARGGPEEGSDGGSVGWCRRCGGTGARCPWMTSNLPDGASGKSAIGQHRS